MTESGSRTVHVLVPAGIDDRARPSGGNRYDRRVCEGLAKLGWQVREHPVQGRWPDAGPAARTALGVDLAQLPDSAVVVLDGLVASAAHEPLRREADRLRLVPLVHLPLGAAAGNGTRAAERAALTAATDVVATSRWTLGWLREHYALRADVGHVVEPGVDPAGLAPGSASGGRLLCVGAVTRLKGYDVLIEALARLLDPAWGDLAWECVCVGALDVDREFAGELLARLADESADESADGLGGRVRFPGPLSPGALDAAYAASDVLVLASRVEAYGMVVTEALAHGLPVVATHVGGVRDALGGRDAASRPGVLVPPEDSESLAGALREWLTGPEERARLRANARIRRASLPGWDVTCKRLSRILEDMVVRR